MNKLKLTVLSGFLLVIGFLGYLLFMNLNLRWSIRSMEREKEKEFLTRLEQSKEQIKQDLALKYQASISAFDDLAKSLESEKSKVNELSEKTKALESEKLKKIENKKTKKSKVPGTNLKK